MTDTQPHIEEAAREWRCFHCDEVFTDADAAREHFGDTLIDQPGCKLNELEGGILGLLREAQRQLEKYWYESDPQSRAFYALGAEHSTKLIEAEQEGYDKGLADGQSLACKATLEEAKEAIQKRLNTYAMAPGDEMRASIAASVIGEVEAAIRALAADPLTPIPE